MLPAVGDDDDDDARSIVVVILANPQRIELAWLTTHRRRVGGGVKVGEKDGGSDALQL